MYGLTRGKSGFDCVPCFVAGCCPCPVALSGSRRGRYSKSRASNGSGTAFATKRSIPGMVTTPGDTVFGIVSLPPLGRNEPGAHVAFYAPACRIFKKPPLEKSRFRACNYRSCPNRASLCAGTCRYAEHGAKLRDELIGRFSFGHRKLRPSTTTLLGPNPAA